MLLRGAHHTSRLRLAQHLRRIPPAVPLLQSARNASSRIAPNLRAALRAPAPRRLLCTTVGGGAASSAAAAGSSAAAGASSTAAAGSSSSSAAAGGVLSAVGDAMRRRFHLPLLGQISPSEVCGHLAFLLAGTAFLDPEILNLRVLSVAAGGATLVFTFFHPIGRPLWLPFGWNVIFMAINGGHIYQILSERQAAERLPPQALELWQSVFAVHGVSKTNFARLLEYGTWTTFREGMTLQEEGRPSNSLFLVVRGKCDVDFAGVKTHSLGDHQFIGDMGLSSGIRISTPVTSPNGVTTSAQTTCLVWRRQQLYQALDQRPELAAAFQAAVGADLVRKLQEPTAADAESRHRLWELRYAAIVEAVLASGEASSEQRQQLAHYRATHNVGDAAHRDALRASGWSEAEFETGRRAAAAAAAAPHRGGAAGIELGLSAAAAAAGEAAAGPGAAAPSSSAEASSSSKEPERRQSSLRRHASLGRWAIPEPPLALWDERKAQVVAVQERLNQFFGTTALEIDGATLAAALSTPHVTRAPPDLIPHASPPLQASLAR